MCREAAVAIVETDDVVTLVGKLLNKAFRPRCHLSAVTHDHEQRWVRWIAESFVLNFHLTVIGRGKTRFWHCNSLVIDVVDILTHPLMNKGLHLLRVGHVVKRFYAVFSTRFDNNVACIDNAFEDALVKVHDVDFVE